MKKKKIIVIVVIVILAIAMAAVRFIFLTKENKPEDTGGEEFYAQAESMGAVSAAYGITSIGTLEEEFPIQGQSTYLEVEETYVTSGEAVTADTKLLKFTQESLDALLEELEQTEKEASLAYRAGLIEFEQEKINLEYEKDSAILAGEQAEAVYEETISGLSQSMDMAEEQLTETKEQIADYQEKISTNYYYNQMQAAQATYDENLALLKERMGEWGVSWSQVISGGGGGGMQMGRSVSGGDVYSQYVTVLSDLYKVLESNLKNLDAAKEAYEDMEQNGQLELQTLQLSLPSLEKTYAEQQESYDSRVLQAKLTMETTLAKAEAAEKNYETDLEKAESDFEALEDAYEEAKENLECFHTRVSSGYYYASGDGELLRFNVRKGQTISEGSRIYTMTNPEKMTVSVSVEQDNVASIKVGDTVTVVSSENGMFEGVVESVNPISTSSSQSSVTYSVQVVMTGDYEALSNNETVTVYFGMKGEE
ncbi:MAG: HlyD family efflux transporter periplasmic adaptor subunit [Lachnospiraceae bacterium]|nr:HlyD family efflux transporter periplasmic adaptor subunit [Lachnospiraceae bacterium]